MYAPLSGDILLFEAGWNKFIIDYGHGALYRAEGKIYESVGRGVCFTDLFENYMGRSMAAYRLFGLEADQMALYITRAIAEAEEMLESQASWYDYLGVARYLVPRLITHKLFHREYGFGYRADKVYWCFEMVATAYRRAGLQLIDERLPPIDFDFTHNIKLEKIFEGPVDPALISI